MPSRLPDYCNSQSNVQDNDQPRRPVLVLRSYNLPHHNNDSASSSENYPHPASATSAPSDLKLSNPASAPHNVGLPTSSEDAPSSPRHLQRPSTGPVLPFSRPFSSPDPSSARVLSPRPVHAVELANRLSTASLPLPMHTPYHILPSHSNQAGADGQSQAQDYPMQESSPAPVLRLNLTENAEAGPSRWSVNNDPGRSTSPRMSPTHSPQRFNRSPAPLPFEDWTQYTDEALMAANASSHIRSYPGSSFHAHHPYSRLSRRPMSPSSMHSAHSYPPPTPPTILTPPPAEERDPSTPYIPFLSNRPPSENTYIAVETLADEYRLHVRLPGYRRDAMYVLPSFFRTFFTRHLRFLSRSNFNWVVHTHLDLISQHTVNSETANPAFGRGLMGIRRRCVIHDPLSSFSCSFFSLLLHIPVLLIAITLWVFGRAKMVHVTMSCHFTCLVILTLSPS